MDRTRRNKALYGVVLPPVISESYTEKTVVYAVFDTNPGATVEDKIMK